MYNDFRSLTSGSDLSSTNGGDVSTNTYNPPAYTCPVQAITTTFSFKTPTGNLGNSKVYASTDAYSSLTAYGYSNGVGSAAPLGSALWGKNDGVGENGLGMLIDAGNDHELDKNHFIQLDLQSIQSKMTPGSQIILTMGSVQYGEGFRVYSSATLGQRGNTQISQGTGVSFSSAVMTVSFVNPGVRYISIQAYGGSNENNVVIESLKFCHPESFVVGDPQFIGLRGQSYQVHGVSGEVYNIVSDKDFQYNSRFVFLDAGECPVVSGKKQKGCWSHPGSFLGELAIKTRMNDQLHIVSGSAKDGFAQVEINGKTMELGESVLLKGEMGSVSYNSTHMVSVKIANWSFDFENSDLFVNQRVSVANFKSLRSHGLLGQTWKDTTYPTALKYIVGQVDDYVIRGNDIFGDQFVFNTFN